MKRKINSSVFIIIAVFTGIYSQSAYDAVYLAGNEQGFGARARSIGGAYTALADDYSALYWNPAGLGYLQKSQFNLELSNQTINNSSIYSGNPNSDKQTYTNLNAIGLALPLPTTRGSLVLAFGYNQVSDFNSNLLISGTGMEPNDIGFNISDDNGISQWYDFNSDVKRLERVDTEGGAKQINVGGAIALSPAFMAGISVGFIGGGEVYNQRYEQFDEDDIYNSYPGDFESYVVNQYLETKLGGIELKFGGSLEMTKRLRLSGVITLPSVLKVTENHSFDDRLIFDDGTIDEYQSNGQWNYKIEKPFTFDGGAAYLGRYLNIAFSARYRDWSQIQYAVSGDDFNSNDYNDLIYENTILKQNYEATIDYHLGAELKLPFFNTTIRSGYAVRPEPYLLSDNEDRYQYTGGIGYQVDRDLTLDITYQHSNWKTTSWSSYTPETSSEKIAIDNLVVGLTYTF